MKILNVINNLAAGGAEKLLTDVLPLQQQAGHTLEVLICNGEANVSDFEERLTQAGIRIINLQTSFYNPLQVFKLVSIIKKGRYDIVHAHLFPSQYWLAFASLLIPKHIKLVKTEHSIFNERKQYKILRPLEKFVYRRYHAIIAITEAVKVNLARWLQSEKQMVMIHNGVNLEQIWQQQKEINQDHYTFIPNDSFTILMVGRFDGIHKDQVSLVRAFQQVVHPETQLFFAGAGPGEQAVKDMVKDAKLEDRVHFLGVRNDVYTLMHLVDLNVLSTNTEGLSGVALESLASGKAFIGSDVDGVRDIVPGKQFLFPKQNPTALYEKIDILMNDEPLRKKMAAEGLRHVKKFDTKQMAQNYLNLYQELMEEH